MNLIPVAEVPAQMAETLRRWEQAEAQRRAIYRGNVLASQGLPKGCVLRMLKRNQDHWVLAWGGIVVDFWPRTSRAIARKPAQFTLNMTCRIGGLTECLGYMRTFLETGTNG